jgi:hypothetical protein
LAGAQSQAPDALSRILRHRDGKRTETQKMGGANEIRESVFDKNNILCGVRLFRLDQQGRITNGVIYDGRKTAVGSTKNTYDPTTGQILFEEMFDKRGRKIRVLYYPGALKDARFAKRTVAFSIDPDAPKAAPREIEGPAAPIAPVTKEEDSFEPGLPQGTAAPRTEREARERNRPAAPPAPEKVPRRSWLTPKAKAVAP